MAVRDKIVLYSQPGALPEDALEDIVSQVEALDMEAVRREIADPGRRPRGPRPRPRGPHPLTASAPASSPPPEVVPSSPAMPSDPLAGRLLVATPVIGDPNFHRSVVFLLDHGTPAPWAW